MSILFEIAARADVPVEGVVRVLTREPVDEHVKRRVLDVFDELGPAETRALERFALAAVHDVFPPEAERADAIPVEDAAAPAVIPTPEIVEAGVRREQDELGLRLVLLLEELVVAVRELKSTSQREQQERVDDLAVLVELITTGWQGIDQRLARLEQLVEQREGPEGAPPQEGGPEPAVLLGAVAAEPERAEPGLAEPERAEAEYAEPEYAEPEEREPEHDAYDEEEFPAPRMRWPGYLAVATLVVAAVVGLLALLGFLPARADLSDLLPDRESPSSAVASTADLPLVHPPGATTAPGTQTGAAVAPPLTGPGATGATTTKSATTQQATTQQATTQRETTQRATTTSTTTAKSSTSPSGTTPRTTGKAAKPPGTGTRTQPAAGTTPRTTPSRVPATIQPARDWVWAPAPSAAYYDIQFLREGKLVYRTQTTGAKLTLPPSVTFPPGNYRWVVRPGIGPRAANRFGPTVVDSRFSVTG